MAWGGLERLHAEIRARAALVDAGSAAVAARPDHRLRWFGLRFASHETEGQYRKWRIATATPFARVGYIGSIPSWCLLLVAVIVLDVDSAGKAVPPIVGWVVLLIVLTALTFPEALRPSVMPLAALANCLAGFLIVWLLSDVLVTSEGPAWRAGAMTGGMLIVMFFGFAIFRVPPMLAVAGVTPYVAFASYRLYDSYDAGRISAVEAGGLGAIQWIAYLGCLLVCIVIEIVSRRSFCKDQIIGAQQRDLQRSAETIRRYVPAAVAKHIVAGDTAGIGEPSRRRVTVLFIDLVGFTMLADRVEAEVLTLIVNDYMSAMTEIVDDFGGTVSEFGGDGFMAMFGAPDEMDPEEQAVRAVRAAQAMQARLPSLEEGWRKLGATEPLKMRAGINSGVLSVGSFGSNGRMIYTAIGLQANIAARLQTKCEPGGILLSDATWHLVKDRICCEPQGEVECKGVHYPVRVHVPLAE
ncbi:adenylate/guanylate cyclase domain-containing protein [Mycobacterium sp. 3519A]|uniref:adenylate/guanylate cyclase domain-containing protein n=1 Tax=Mycobacterium sp. 3519A TaxID=2057184 RepID=UPI00135701E1|nr:adenylate/guanylate cyclase domain-containing protein [Mycobacterium sp. 3519A]